MSWISTYQKGKAQNENVRGHGGEVDLHSLYNFMFLLQDACDKQDDTGLTKYRQSQ